MAPQPEAQPKQAGVDPELVAKLKEALQAPTKPKLVTNADQFGTDDDAGKPFVQCTMEVHDGRVHIVLPEELPYALTRDTSSRNRRSVVCRLDDPNGVEWELTHNGKQIPVKLTLSSTLNLSAQAIKV